MLKRLFIIVIIVASLALSKTAYTESESVLGDMTKKFKRGAINTFTGWLEFPIQIVKGYKEGFVYDNENKVRGLLGGVYDGITHSLGRTLSGIADMVTFWAANPQENINSGIPFDAEYAWEEGVPHNMFDPNFTDAALMPIVNKFLRGAGNTLFGFIEVPNQTKKGISRGTPTAGTLKGLWFWCSREISGVYDIATTLLPNPEYTVGVSFDEEWPWESFIDPFAKEETEEEDKE
jgi:putative exosortase-associated protein (TIGR04073 family)